jgi:hypothetical protein
VKLLGNLNKLGNFSNKTTSSTPNISI